jgi:hypothetical protein
MFEQNVQNQNVLLLLLLLLLLIPQSSDWLAAFRLNLMQAILFINQTLKP